MATKLSVFNQALGLLAQPTITSVESTKADVRELNAHWDNVVDLCHEATAWDFAKVRAELARQVSTPTFGYSYYYSLPADLLRILKLSETGEEGDELLAYEAEPGKIATSVETVYCLYVSNTSRSQVGRWSESFARYVACELALISCGKINSSREDFIIKQLRRAKSDATGLDATQGAPQRRRHGSWSRAARGYQSNREQG